MLQLHKVFSCLLVKLFNHAIVYLLRSKAIEFGQFIRVRVERVHRAELELRVAEQYDKVSGVRSGNFLKQTVQQPSSIVNITIKNCLRHLNRTIISQLFKLHQVHAYLKNLHLDTFVGGSSKTAERQRVNNNMPIGFVA